MAKGSRIPIQLDWFNVTYASVIRIVLVVALAAGSGGAYWYQVGIKAPRENARDAIRQAETKLGEATAKVNDFPTIQEVVESSKLALREARDDFSAMQYDESRVAAMNAENYAIQALRMVGAAEEAGPVARFAKLEGNVRIKRAGEYSWEQANARMTLQEGDSIKTSSSGSAQLIYFDGAVSTISPGTLLTIRHLSEDPVTKVRRVSEKLDFGEVHASTQDRNVRGSYHEVATAKINARTEQAGEFRVAYSEDAEDSAVDVFGGRVQVANDSKREELVAGEGIRAGRDGRLGSKQSLPGVPRLTAPPDQRVFIWERPEVESITLSWEMVPGAREYRLVISDKALFTEPLYDARRKGTSAVLEGVGEGSYHWKVAAITDAGLTGEFSSARRFRVSSQKIKDRGDSEPPKLELTEFVQVGMMVIVNGSTEPGATLWADDEKIEVDDSGTFYAVIRLQKEGTNDIVFVAQDTAGNETRITKRAFVDVY